MSNDDAEGFAVWALTAADGELIGLYSTHAKAEMVLKAMGRMEGAKGVTLQGREVE